MVTAVTVTDSDQASKGVYYVSEGEVLILAGERTNGKRERMPISLSFGYTQTIIRVYANNCVPVRKQMCAYTRIESSKFIVIFYESSAIIRIDAVALSQEPASYSDESIEGTAQLTIA